MQNITQSLHALRIVYSPILAKIHYCQVSQLCHDGNKSKQLLFFFSGHQKWESSKGRLFRTLVS